MRILLIALAVCAASVARGAEHFVATNGSDTNGDGSFGNPYRTLTHVLEPANDIVAAGDTVTLRGLPGANVYNEIEVRLRVPLTLRSRAGEWAHIACPLNVPDTVCVQIDPDASGSRLSRLEISGGWYYGVFLQTDWDSGGNPTGTGASNIVIEDSKIHDTGRDAIKITPKCNDVTIRRTEIWNSGAGYPPGTPPDDKNAEGIDNVNGSRMTVADSHIHDTATTGVYFKGGAADVVIERNRIENTGAAGILVGFDTSPEFFDTTVNPGWYEAVRGIVRNNCVRGTRYAGIGLYASQNALVANNTIVNAASAAHAALYFGVTLQDYDPAAGRPPNTGARIRNNLVVQNGGRCVAIRYANELGGLSGLTGNTGTDYNAFPATCTFIDSRPGSTIAGGGPLAAWRTAQNADAHSIAAALAVDANCRLPQTSAAVDQGETLAEVVDDIERDARVAPYDIGADEARSDAIFTNGFE
jgi:hypothetical protein